jgi:four helix bundle suffix protein
MLMEVTLWQIWMASNRKRLTVFETDVPQDQAYVAQNSFRREGMTDPIPPTLIPPHGGYRTLKSYQMAEIIFDATVAFCDRFIDKRSRTSDQMIQAARSGKQNIAEGSMASATSKKTELKLIGVARASLEELLLDFQDFLRQRELPLWAKEHPQAREVRALANKSDKSYSTYRPYFEGALPETAANAAVCLIHQTNYLLDRQLQALQKAFLEEGGFTERLYRVRSQTRGPWKKP